MSTAYFINGFFDATTTNEDGQDMTATGDTLMVTAAGSLLALAGGDGINSSGGSEQITLNGLAYSSAADGVFISGTDTSCVVDGEAAGASGVYLQGNQDFLTVGAKGQVSGGVDLRTTTTDDDTIVNDGEIVGSVGIFSDGTSGQNSFNNAGTISVTSTGIIAEGEKTGDAIHNSGHINATNVGIQVGDNAGYSNVITNSGVIQANECIEVSSDHTIDIISNSGLISADQNGYAIDIQGTVGGYLDTIENSGAIQGSMLADASSRVSIDNTGTWSQGGFSLSAGDSTLTNSGQIEAADYAIYMSEGGNKLTNSGSITGAISMGAGGGPTNSLINSGEITGNITFSSGKSTLANSGQIYGTVTLAADGSLINDGTIHGTLYAAASDVIDDSRGVVTGGIRAWSSNTFEYEGNFGNETINKFIAGTGSTHDVIQFAANDFGSFAAVQKDMTQVGADVVIRLDTTDSITLTHVTLSSLVSADFRFV